MRWFVIGLLYIYAFICLFKNDLLQAVVCLFVQKKCFVACVWQFYLVLRLHRCQRAKLHWAVEALTDTNIKILIQK